MKGGRQHAFVSDVRPFKGKLRIKQPDASSPCQPQGIIPLPVFEESSILLLLFSPPFFPYATYLVTYLIILQWWPKLLEDE